MAPPWTRDDLDLMFEFYPPERARPAAEAVRDLATRLGRTTDAVTSQWNDAHYWLRGMKTAASQSLIGYLMSKGYAQGSRVAPGGAGASGSAAGSEWSSSEIQVVVEDYFEMLRAELDGQAYNKADHRRALRLQLSARSEGSIELKHQNISAVLFERGLRFINGYKPLSNYQHALAAEVDRRLAGDEPLAGRLALPESSGPLSGNKAIENAAIAWVMQLERRAGRTPADRRFVAAYSADIQSDPRTIEIKAYGGSVRGSFLWLEVAQYNAALLDPQFYIYIVDNISQGDRTKFRLKVLHGERLTRLLDRAKERRYFEMPLPVKEFDDAPGEDAL